MANEEFVHYIWKHWLHRMGKMRTTCGKSLEVLRQGEQNFHAGPDFFNARIKIDQLVWAGNVEIHQQASDWIKHGHQLDPAYDNVILHVVLSSDIETKNSRGRRIVTLVLEIPFDLSARYEILKRDESWLPCSHFIGQVPSIEMNQWLTLLQAERLHQKTSRISRILHNRDMNREETFYMAMASGYGLPINSLPFEMVSSGIPLHLLMELRDNLPVLEALLFGQSGFLHPNLNKGPYAASLLAFYNEIAESIPGTPVPSYLWKFHRLRPPSFPTLRVSQFASLIHLRFPLTESLFKVISINEMEQLLRVKASEYWNTHYVFGKCSPPFVKYMGHQSILTLIINVIVPFLFTIGKTEHDPGTIRRAREILHELEAESNQIIEKWTKFGVKPCNAFESQALLQLYNGYCKQKRCLHCQIGAGFIKAEINEK